MEADEKECPFCAEIIKAKAKVCKHCRSNLEEDAFKDTDATSTQVTNEESQTSDTPPPTLEEQIANLGEFDRYGTRKEIKFLPEAMRPGEIIKAMTSGLLDGTTWLIVVTDQRVLFLDKGFFYGLKQLEIPLKSITGIVQKTGLMFGGLNITAASITHTITTIDKKDVKRVCDVISMLIHKA